MAVQRDPLGDGHAELSKFVQDLEEGEDMNHILSVVRVADGGENRTLVAIDVHVDFLSNALEPLAFTINREAILDLLAEGFDSIEHLAFFLSHFCVGVVRDKPGDSVKDF